MMIVAHKSDLKNLKLTSWNQESSFTTVTLCAKWLALQRLLPRGPREHTNDESGDGHAENPPLQSSLRCGVSSPHNALGFAQCLPGVLAVVDSHLELFGAELLERDYEGGSAQL